MTGIIHGDIKPANILISTDDSGGLVAKLADFGHSIIARDKSDVCRLPSSEPWTAPEWHHRHHSFAEARRMDIYSFAMVCLWLFINEPCALSSSRATLLIIQDYKREGSLVTEARKLINCLDASTTLKQGLESFFSKTLTRESRKSIRNIAELIPYLDPDKCAEFSPQCRTKLILDRQIQWVKANGSRPNHTVHHVDFCVSTIPFSQRDKAHY